MASKINTDNPKHHKYVDVNKYERKKIITKRYNRIYNFINNSNNYSVCDFAVSLFCRLVVYGLKHCTSRFKYTTNYTKSYFNQKGCKIIFDDCNHKTYRVIKNGNLIRYNKYYKVKHFKFK